MRSQDAEAVGGTFTNDVREHMLKQLRGSNVESSAAAAVPSDDVVAAPEEEKSEAASDLAVPEQQPVNIVPEEQSVHSISEEEVIAAEEDLPEAVSASVEQPEFIPDVAAPAAAQPEQEE